MSWFNLPLWVSYTKQAKEQKQRRVDKAFRKAEKAKREGAGDGSSSKRRRKERRKNDGSSSEDDTVVRAKMVRVKELVSQAFYIDIKAFYIDIKAFYIVIKAFYIVIKAFLHSHYGVLHSH